MLIFSIYLIYLSTGIGRNAFLNLLYLGSSHVVVVGVSDFLYTSALVPPSRS